MCGIAGVMTVDGAAPAPGILDLLERALRHRGPDGAGRYSTDGVGLVHTRLAIIDLAGGAQPLFSPSRRALVANGEIYNYIELEAGELSGVPFATSSDSEVILHLYEKYGIDCLHRLRGMFAFGLHDPQEKTLLVARDPFGIKPLYYVETPSCFAFASEAQALVAAGLAEARQERRPAGELLQLQFTTGPDTIFAGVHRVLPGEALLIKGGRIIRRTRIAALPEGAPQPMAEVEAKARLDDVLMDSVRVHQRSDVPYGLFLSSGIDSTSILACMTRLNDKSVQAYTASFPGTGVADEFPEANRIAGLFGARHIKVEVRPKEFFDLLPEIVAAVDDPTADYAIVPTYILAREAVKDLKVILCGEGGDELFAGYSRYRRQIRPWWLGGRVRRRRGPFSAAGILYEEPADWRDGIVAAEQASATQGRSRLQIAQAADCVDYLPHNLLTKLDRCLMAHGVEGRTPFLDPRIAEFGFRLPQKLQLKGPWGKYLLRRWLADQAPQVRTFARKKGFTVPVGDWIRGEGARLGPLVAADPAVAAICDPAKVKAVFASDEKRQLEAAWRLLFYALWHRRHIRGLRPDGDVFHCLAG